MPDNPQPGRFRAVFTVTVETKPGGDYYFDHNDLVRNVTPWIEGALEDRDDIRDVTVVEADAPAAVPSAPADRAAILREAADAVAADTGFHIRYGAAVDYANHYADELRRMADEAQQPETQAEDPARIDRLRPEFTEHASVESIDVQLRRARSQQRRWHLRVEWLISLRQARVEQKARGEWPAASDRCPHGCDVSTCPCLACEVDQPDGETQQPETGPFVPPAHYRGRDGTAYCVHAIPIGPDSCPHCRELADDEPAAVSQPGKEA